MHCTAAAPSPRHCHTCSSSSSSSLSTKDTTGQRGKGSCTALMVPNHCSCSRLLQTQQATNLLTANLLMQHHNCCMQCCQWAKYTSLKAGIFQHYCCGAYNGGMHSLCWPALAVKCSAAGYQQSCAAVSGLVASCIQLAVKAHSVLGRQ